MTHPQGGWGGTGRRCTIYTLGSRPPFPSNKKTWRFFPFLSRFRIPTSQPTKIGQELVTGKRGKNANCTATKCELREFHWFSAIFLGVAKISPLEIFLPKKHYLNRIKGNRYDWTSQTYHPNTGTTLGGIRLDVQQSSEQNRQVLGSGAHGERVAGSWDTNGGKVVVWWILTSGVVISLEEETINTPLIHFFTILFFRMFIEIQSYLPANVTMFHQF